MSITLAEYIEAQSAGQRAFVRDLIDKLKELDGVSVYSTGANGGDLRVRVTPAARVLFTMYWQHQNQCFFCRAYIEPEFLKTNCGVSDIRLEPNYEPLISSFKFVPNFIHTIGFLFEIIINARMRSQFSLAVVAKKSRRHP